MSTTKLRSNGAEEPIENFSPRTKDEFDEFSKRLTTIITSVGHLPHYAMFINGFVKAICEPLGSEDVKKVSSAVTALYNEKLKSEKGSGKKKGGKKPALVVAAAKSAAPKFDTASYGDDDFDDFM
jgi:translation initiation factor 3 subunit J